MGYAELNIYLSYDCWSKLKSFESLIMFDLLVLEYKEALFFILYLLKDEQGLRVGMLLALYIDDNYA